MNAITFLYVAAGGAFGSMARYAVMSLIGKLHGPLFPYGTLTVNIAGSFLMGVWIAIIATMLPERQRDLHMLIAVGALGGFTTFSTFSLDAFMLFDRGLYVQAGSYILGSVCLSVLALFAGMVLINKWAA